MEQSPAHILLVNRSIILDNDKMLVVRRSAEDRHNAGLWEFPGGKVDKGERLKKGLEREVLEETGLVVEPISQLVYAHDELLPTSRGGRLYVALFHVAKLLSGDLRISEEHSDASWDTLQEVRRRKLAAESRLALNAMINAGVI
jgi:8-oxo-dGTP diphosphatase